MLLTSIGSALLQALLSISLLAFGLFSLHRLLIVGWLFRKRKVAASLAGDPREAMPRTGELVPFVTVQLPVYNEWYVVARLIESAGRLDYPKDKLEIQVLDDSTDETSHVAAASVARLRELGIDAVHLRRGGRHGFKAGALAFGLARAKGDLIAIFDADFVIPSDFLTRTVGYFSMPSLGGGTVGMVQARWEFVNENESLLTKAQALSLRAHFRVEHQARFNASRFFNFNGTAGIWRAEAIRSAGGWQGDTLTEDLDLSYRAQLAGWRFQYVDDLICPSELPPTFKAFKTQQHRWIKGMAQVAVKLLPRILSAPIPLGVKVEAMAHMLAPLTYVFSLVSFLLLLPILLVSDGAVSQQLRTLYAHGLGWTTMFVMLYHGAAERDTLSLRGVPGFLVRFAAVLALGVGNSLNAVRAMFEGFAGLISPFVRTPKFAGLDRLSRGGFRYHSVLDPLVLGESTLAIYGVITFVVAVLCCTAITPWAFLLAAGSSATALGQLRETARGL